MSKKLQRGQEVVVRNDHPDGHIRTPTYVRGKRGVILGDYGAWPNPEELAYGKSGLPKRTNYWVQFRMDDIWSGKGDYGPNDTVAVEIYEHWLQPAEGAKR